MDERHEAELLDAIEIWTRAIRRDPRDVTARKARGAAFAELGNFERASRDFAKALRLDPSPLIRYYRGLDYLRMGEPGMAIAEFTNALVLDPGFLEAVEHRADAFRVLHDEARAALDDRQARRIRRRQARTRLVVETAQQDAREVPLKTA